LNQSIVSGVFPDEWKLSKVIPLFKRGERSDLNNYRTISIIPVVAKVFERIVYDQLYEYLTDNNLISSHQSGFRTLHSTVTALLEATDNWAYSIDQGDVNTVVFLDLKKAFDTVDHNILLSKLKKGEEPIKQVNYTKSLGVFIDHNLSWNIHIEKLCKKIASGIGALKRTRPFVPYHTLLSIFNSLVQLHFDYCSVVWGNCSKTFSTKLQKLQNRAARIITYSSFNVNADLLIDRLGWKKLNSQRQIHRPTMVYKSLNGLAPHYLQEKFVERNTITDYSLRD
jgi:hypothetical protein